MEAAFRCSRERTSCHSRPGSEFFVVIARAKNSEGSTMSIDPATHVASTTEVPGVMVFAGGN